MRGIFASCVLAALLLAEVWADHHGHHDHGSNHSDEGQPSYFKLSRPNADFAFALYKNLNAKTDAGKNIFYSPQVDVAYERLFHEVGRSQDNQTLDVGNAVVVRTGFNPLENFLTEIKNHYSGDLFNVDLDNAAEAVAKLNTYIANKTHDRIKDMVKEFDQDMDMMLINYVYFKGKWENPFRNVVTHKADFHVDENTKVQVDMMTKTGSFNTYFDADNNATVIMLPYKGTTSMMIVLPDEGKMKEVEGRISKEHLMHWRRSGSMKHIAFDLPTFSISADTCLKDTLKEMGITKAFEDDADFSGISGDTKLKLSRVSHRASLSVTEEGTEEVDTTTLAPVSLNVPLKVAVDRPFLVFVLDSSVKSILFMGKINNPTLI
uniref:Alpha-1-antitrypsin homolog n=1 Tax=Stegastes partitus TaxID=144197 RepID=A0A3B5A930_9TELE